MEIPENRKTKDISLFKEGNINLFISCGFNSVVSVENNPSEVGFYSLEL